MNKVVVGTSFGRYHVVNVKSGRALFTSTVFTGTGKSDPVPGASARSLQELVASRKSSSSFSSASAPAATPGIMCALALPRADVVAFGTSDGGVAVHNCRADRSVVRFQHAPLEGAPSGGVTALAFCTDPARPPRLLSGTASGELALWDLVGRRLLWHRAWSHRGGVTSAHFLRGQPRVVTLGRDNAVRQWLLDGLDELPRVVRQREGHFGPVHRARFAHADPVEAVEADGADARLLEAVTAGADRCVRLTHCAAGLERQDRELSQGAGLAQRARQLGLDKAAGSSSSSSSSMAGAGDDAAGVLGGSALLRLPPVTCMAVSDRREGEWGGIVTAHRGLGGAYVWDWSRKAMTDRVLVLPGRAERAATSGGEEVTACCISPCGSFAVLAGARGTVARFNLQTGAPRGCFPPSARRHRALAMRGRKRAAAQPDLGGPGSGDGGVGGELGGGTRRRGLEEAQGMGLDAAAVDRSVAYLLGCEGAPSAAVATAEEAERAGPGGVIPAHAGAVTGVAMDARNRSVVTAGQDARLRWWGAGSHRLEAELDAGEPVTALACHRPSGLLVAALASGRVSVWDVETRRLVRTFAPPPSPTAASASSAPPAGGGGCRVSDMAVTPDGRAVVVAHADGSLRVLDVAAARVSDWLWFEDPVATLDVSPVGDVLLTAHRGRPGLSLWSCRAFLERVPARPPPSAPTLMDLPEADADAGAGAGADGGKRARSPAADGGDEAGGEGEGKDEDEDEGGWPAGRELLPVELSGVPQSQWEMLPHLDSISARSRPSQPARAPEAAPFFLPTVTTAAGGPAFTAAASAVSASASAPAPGSSLSAQMDAAASFFAGAGAGAAEAGAAAPTAVERAAGSGQLGGAVRRLLEAVEAVATLRRQSDAPAPAAVRSTASQASSKASSSAEQEEDAGNSDDDQDGSEGHGDDADGALEVLELAAAGMRVGETTPLADVCLEAVRADTEPDAARWLCSTLRHGRAASEGALALLRGVPPAAAWRVLQELGRLSPARADACVTALCMGRVDLPGRARLLALLRCLCLALACRAWFDLAQAHLGLLLRAHGDTLAACPELLAAVAQIAGEQEAAAEAVGGVLDHAAGVSRWVVRAV